MFLGRAFLLLPPPFLNIPFAVLPFSGCLDFVSLKLARYFFCVCPWSVIATPTNHRWWPSLHSSTKKDNLRTAEWVSFKLLFFHIFLLLRDFFGYFCEYIWNDLNNFYLLLGISIALTRRARPCIRKGIIHLEKKKQKICGFLMHTIASPKPWGRRLCTCMQQLSVEFDNQFHMRASHKDYMNIFHNVESTEIV